MGRKRRGYENETGLCSMTVTLKVCGLLPHCLHSSDKIIGLHLSGRLDLLKVPLHEPL